MSVEDSNFHAIYQKYAGQIYRYALFRSNSYQDAENITARTFAHYLKKGGSLSSAEILPWLFKVTSRFCSAQPHKTTKSKRGKGGLPGTPVSTQFWRDEVAWRAVSMLKPRKQQVIYLKVMEGMTFKQMVNFVGKGEKAVRALFYHGVAVIRSVFSSELAVDSNISPFIGMKSHGKAPEERLKRAFCAEHDFDEAVGERILAKIEVERQKCFNGRWRLFASWRKH